jgi:hypothetical protein
MATAFANADDGAGRSGLSLWFFLVVVLCSAASVLIAFAFDLSRQSDAAAGLLFWLGFAVVVVPLVARLFSKSISPVERILLLVMAGLTLFFVKVLHDPSGFTYHDEFIHWRTTDDILRTGSLFRENPLLFVSPNYPGLEAITAAMAGVGGLSIFSAGVAVVASAKMLLMLGLFAFFKRASGSGRIAGFACCLYMANPGFVFFDSQFAYESLALPLAVVALLLVLIGKEVRARMLIFFALALVLVTIVMVHHLIAYVLFAFLLSWCSLSFILRRPAEEQRWMTCAVLLSGAAILTWTVLFARETISYLAPIFESPLDDIVRILTGGGPRRAAFQSYSGEEATILERGLILSSLLLVAMGIMAGALLTFRDNWRNSLHVGLILAALLIPWTVPLHFVSTGGEIANRASNSLFIAGGFVCAFVLQRIAQSPRARHFVMPLLVLALFLCIAGGLETGSGPTSRILPSTYHVAADSQSVDAKGLDAADWALAELGPDNRIATDRTNRLLLGSYGHQVPLVRTKGHEGDVLAPIFTRANLSRTEQALLIKGDVSYLLVDMRLSSGLPVFGVYFENGEENSFAHRTPIDRRALTKFDRLRNIDRLYDNGDIVAYDVRRLARGEATQ